MTPGMGPPCRPPSGPELSELAAEKIYTGSDPSDLCVVDNQLFVADKNTIHRVPLTGGQSEAVTLPGPANIGIILANSIHLFFEVNDVYWRVPIDATGATPERVYQAASTDLIQAVDDSNIYFVASATSNVDRIAVNGGVAQTFVSRVEERLFEVIDGFAYFSRDLGLDYSVHRMPLSGGGEEKLADLPLPYWGRR
jgi:hypothetical protein